MPLERNVHKSLSEILQKFQLLRCPNRLRFQIQPAGDLKSSRFEIPKDPCIRCSKLEPFVTRKSGHIWRIWAEMTQMLMPKSTKVAQIHLPECNSAKICQISAKICQISAKIRRISQASFHKRALTLNTQLLVKHYRGSILLSVPIRCHLIFPRKIASELLPR